MEFALPEIGEGVYEAELVRWLVKPGDLVKRGQPLLEVMTDKATMEVPSPFAGAITAVRGKEGDRVKVGSPLLSYESAGNPVGIAAASVAGAVPAAVTPNGAVKPPPRTMPIQAAPSVRQLARKLGIDLTAIPGSGPGGRVLIEDISKQIAQPPAAGKGKAEARPDYGTPGTRIKLQGLRRRIAEHMVHAKQTIPHYSLIEECDVTDLVKLREDLKEPLARAGVKLTYLAFFVKAVVAGLKEVPLVNASLDEAAGEIVLRDRYHVGIAAATPAGLIVPVVRDADKKDIVTIARDIDQLVGDARAGRSKLEDLRDGTFTVTSVGNVGGLISTPIVNHPEVGILGVGRIVKRPVYDERDQVRPAFMLYLSLSFDHRVVDGAVAAAFTNVVLRELRRPATMLVKT